MSDNITLGIVIKADGKGAESTINSLNKTIEKTGDATRKAAAGWSELSKVGAQKLQAIETAKRLTQGLNEAGLAAQKAARQAATGAGLMNDSFGKMSTSAKLAGTAIAGMMAAFSARAVLEAAREMDRLRGMMEAASGGAGAFASNMAFVQKVARDLGVNLQGASEGFASLTAAAQGTNLQGQATRDIFLAVAKAAAALGKSTTDTQGILLALSQMISKGTVSMEELRGQLGERLPGAFQLAAKAMGVTTQELDKLVSSGQVTAEQLLPKLAKALDDTYSGARFDRLNNNVERLDNAWTRFKANVIDSESMSRSLGMLATMLDKLNAVVDKSKAFGADPFQIIPGKAQVQRALAGQATSNPLETTSAEAIQESAQKQIQALGQVGAAWARLTEAQRGYFEAAAKKYGIPQELLMAQFYQESRFKPNARSGAGAYGLGQLMPGTGRSLAAQEGQRYDPGNELQNVMLGAKYLRQNLDKFNGNVKQALASYNAGPAAVMSYGVTGKPYFDRGRWKNTAGRITQSGIPPFKETQDYVDLILNKWLPQIKGGNLQGLDVKSMALDSDKLGKELRDAQNQQYQDYVAHLKLREQAFDDYAKKAIAEQRTMMERLEIQRKAAEDQAKAAMASGDTTAIAKAEQIQAQFIQRKHDLLLQGIQIEEEATKKKIANIGMEIAQAQKLNQYQDVDKLRADRQSELAELAALAERRKQIELSANADIAKNAAEYEDQKRKAQRQAADDYAAQVAAQREITEAESDFFRQKMELVQQMQAASADARKQDIDGQLEQARNQAAIAEAERQQAMEGKTGIEAMQLARENLNARLNDTINLIYMERDAALEKLRIDGDILFSQRQLLEVYKAIAEQNGDRKAVLDIEQKLEQVYASQSKNIRDRIQAMNEAAGKEAKAKTDTSKDVAAIDGNQVKETQLRLNAFWDQYMQRLNDYASLWQQITGDTQDGFSRMAIAMGEYSKQAAQIGQYFDQNPQAFGDMTGAVEGLQQGQAALAAMAKTMIALRSNYKEGTQGYADMTAAAERMMEVQRALQLVEGVLAVIHQATSGDVYTAIPRMLGVAAMIASMGVNTGASGGMSNKQAQAASQAGGSTAAGGGVFGDTSAKSESISKALDIVAENSSADLAYSAGMLRSLTNIELAMKGTTNAIIRGVSPQAVAGLGSKSLDQMINPLNGISDPLTKALHKLVFNVTTKISNWGISSVPQALDQIIAKGFQGMNWTEVTKTTKILGITIGKSVKNLYSELDTGVEGQITRVIRGMADTVREAGQAFGISGEQFNAAMRGFVVNFGTLATKGMKADELQKAVQQVFSSMSDDMAQQFQSRFDLDLEPFMRAGEGMFEVLVRVSNSINQATGLLAQFGMEAINYKDIIEKQGDVAAEIVRQSIVAFEGVGSAIGAYVDQAVGSAEELISVYKDLLIVSDVAKIVGFNMNDLTQALIVTSGGVAQFLSNLQTYQTEIAGGSEYARQIITLRREFGKLGLALPDSNRGFVRLVNSINTSTEAGQKLYAQVLSLADAFSKAQQEAARLEELRAKYLPTDSMKGYRDQIQQVAKDFADIIEGTLARLPGGPTYLKRTTKIDVLRDRIDSRDDDKAIIQAEIDTLEAKAKLTAKEKQRLASLRQQRKDLSDEIAGYQKQIDDINKLIAKNPKSQALLEERAKLMEEQGDALIKTLADIWDSMTAAITQAKETLKSIQDSIFELAGGAGGSDIKYGMANARRITAESAYNAYSGNDITKLNTLADAYYKGIMDEYQAKLELIEAPKKALEKERELRQKAHDEEVAALEKQLSKVTELRDAIEQIQKYSLSLKLGSQSTLSPGDQMREAQKQYEDLLKRAQSGDVKALQELTSGASSYLELAQKYFGSGTQYANIYDGVQKAMESLGAMDPGDADSIQAKIDKLNEEHGKYLESIDKQIADLNIDQQIKDLQAATVEKLQALADNLGPRISEAEKQAADDMKKLFDETVKANTWNERQTAALEELAKTFGVVMPDTGKPEPALPTPTDDWVQDIFDKWNSGQTGYKPPTPAFTMSTAADGRAMTTQSMENMPVIIDAPKPINLENMPKFINDSKPSPYTDEVVEELRLLQGEMKALVVTQSGANPEVIAQLQTLNDRLESLERQQRIKA